MSWQILTSKLILLLLLTFLAAAQCQAVSSPQATPTFNLPTPTPILIPPLEPGDGTDLIDRLLEKGVLRVGIRVWPDADFSPPAFRGFSNAATGGALNGFEIDIARQVAEQLGLELEFVEAYPPVIASGDWRGEWDIAIASLTPFDSVEGASAARIVYSQPYGYIPLGVLLPITANSELPFSQLSGRKIGVFEYSVAQHLLISDVTQLTVQNHPVITQAISNIEPIPLSNLQRAIKQLGQPQNEDAPQIDAIFGPIPIFQAAVKREFPVQLAAQGEAIGFQPLAIAVVPQDGLKVDRLISEINNVLTRLQRQGTLSEIYFRWYEQDLSQPP